MPRAVAPLLNEIATALAGAGRLEAILGACAEVVSRWQLGATVRIWLLPATLGAIELAASAGEPGPPLDPDAATRCARERRPHASGGSARLPIMIDGRPIGVIEVVARRELGADALAILELATTVLAIGIDRKRAHGALYETVEQAEAALVRADEARHAAEAANRGKDEFLAILSHELRTPLTSMLGWTRLLRSGRLDVPTATRALEVIERSATTQAKLIDDILDVSRIVAGKLRIDVQTIERLGPLVETGLDALRPMAAAKGVALDLTVSDDTGPIAGDAARLQQVVWNIVSNAVKFTPAGGRVAVRCERVDGSVELRVSDSGPGIPAEFLPHVFERFRQAEAASTRSHGGLGLGLAIARHLVERHGGTIRAESPGELGGASFVAHLPVAIARGAARDPVSGGSAWGGPAPGADVDTPAERLPSLEGLRVLVVEDVPDTRALVAAILEGRGAKVLGVETTGAALLAIETTKPHVIVSDIGLPEEDGLALIRKLRVLPPERGGRVPAAALTAYASYEDRSRALAAGYQAHVPKPIDPAGLVVVVAKLAGRLARG